MLLIKVAWYVLRVKFMHFGSPLDPQVFEARQGKAKLSYIYEDVMRGEAKLCLSMLTPVFHHLPRIGPKQLCVSSQLGYVLECLLFHLFKTNM